MCHRHICTHTQTERHVQTNTHTYTHTHTHERSHMHPQGRVIFRRVSVGGWPSPAYVTCFGGPVNIIKPRLAPVCPLDSDPHTHALKHTRTHIQTHTHKLSFTYTHTLTRTHTLNLPYPPGSTSCGVWHWRFSTGRGTTFCWCHTSSPPSPPLTFTQ